MKRTLLLMLLFASQAFARSVAPPQITVTNATTGATSLDGSFCLLFESRNAGAVDGALAVRTSMLGVGVNLAAWDAEGNLLLSCPLKAEQSGDISLFFFMVKKEFLRHAKLTVFTRDNMYECRLADVSPRAEKSDMQSVINTIRGKTPPEQPTKPSTATK